MRSCPCGSLQKRATTRRKAHLLGSWDRPIQWCSEASRSSKSAQTGSFHLGQVTREKRNSNISSIESIMAAVQQLHHTPRQRHAVPRTQRVPARDVTSLIRDVPGVSRPDAAGTLYPARRTRRVRTRLGTPRHTPHATYPACPARDVTSLIRDVPSVSRPDAARTP